MKAEAHCAWIQTCGCLSLATSGAILSRVLDPTGFRQLLNYLYKVRGLLPVQYKSLTLRGSGTRCPSSTLLFLKILGRR